MTLKEGLGGERRWDGRTEGCHLRRASWRHTIMTTNDSSVNVVCYRSNVPCRRWSCRNLIGWKASVQSTQGFLPRAAHRPRCVQDSDHRPKLSKVRNSPSSLNLCLKAWLWLQPRDEAPDLKIDLEILCHHLDWASGGKEACHSLGRSCRATQNTMNWPLVRPLSSRWRHRPSQSSKSRTILATNYFMEPWTSSK
jgi:hypothetical protein